MFAEVVDAAAQADVLVSYLPRFSGAGRRNLALNPEPQTLNPKP
jgi:hypothetical protein